MEEQSLQRLELSRVTESIAGYAESPAAAAWIAAMRPLEDARARSDENRLLGEALRRQGEPGAWCEAGRGELGAALREDHADGRGVGWSGARLVEVLSWLEAAAATREAWKSRELTERFPLLAAEVERLPELAALRKRLSTALEPDGRLSDQASPDLKRARHELGALERGLQEKLMRWARPFGEGAYVTRHGDRFVVLVPAAGFPRRRGIVHDVSNSGQSLFVEPLEACEANNRLIEMAARVDEEERRVLAELTAMVRAAQDALWALESILVHLDSLRARARWASESGGVAIEPGGDRLRLVRARHPLLALKRTREDLVPLDLDLEPAEKLLLVSGPNMGGKTVLLKTVGLAVALAHAGLPVLAGEGSAIPEIDELLVDLGDEQSLDQGLSTFAAHLRSLSTMARRAGPRTLVLCDELGAGTDPEEGGALGRALIEHFAARGAWGVITTHLGSLKRVAGDVRGVVNGSLDFDHQTLTPRYRFLAGIPGASHALGIAERLGLDPEIVARARAITPEESRALELLLQELEAMRARWDQEVRELKEARQRAEGAAAESRAAAEDARRTLEELRRRLTRESEALLSRARELWQTVQREARSAEKTRAGAQGLRDRVREVEAEVETLGAGIEAAGKAFGLGESAAPRLDPKSLRPGVRVRVIDLNVEAELVSGPDAEGRVVLRRGSWSINTQVDRLGPPERSNGATGRLSKGEKESGRTTSGPSATWEVPEEAPWLVVDVRGMDVEEALRVVDEALDRGVLSGLSELRVIHGVGRGVLRAAVERHLRDHLQVTSHRLGELAEGGRGVTVAALK